MRAEEWGSHDRISALIRKNAGELTSFLSLPTSTEERPCEDTVRR